MKKYTIVSGLILSSILLASADRRRPVPVSPRSEQSGGLEFEQVQNPATSKPRPEPTAATSPLTPAALRQLLQRLTPVKAQAQDKQDFALRPSSLPAPKTGKRVSQPFPVPPSTAPPAVAAKPVEVLRFAPEGEVELAPQLSLTFNQPMVALSSARTPASVPVKLTPETPGKWRWVGTQTLVFQPKTRLPMATEYRAEVSPEAVSANGSKLAKPVSWTFLTPPPKVQQGPSGTGCPLDPVLFLGFDQDVDATQITALVKLTGNGQPLAVRAATRAEIAEDDTAQRLVKDSQPKRWVALKANLAPGTSYVLTVPAGTPSAEGPRKTAADQVFSFRTYDPLQMDDSAENLVPGNPLWLSFNNPLDAAKFRPESVTVTPELPGQRAVVRGDGVWIHGRTRGRTTYTVTVAAGLKDVHGQQLAQPATAKIAVGSARPLFVHPNKDFLILDPAAPPSLTFQSLNHKSLRVKVYAVQPSDWEKYREALNQRWNEKELKFPGKLVQETSLDAGAEPDQLRDVVLDLTRPLADGGSNQLIVEVAPSDIDTDERRWSTFYGWVQRTELGLNLISDKKQVVAWVTRLQDGKAVAGAQVRGGKDASATSDAKGQARLGNLGESAVQVRSGQDLLFLPAGYWSEASDTGDRVVWYVTDDRKLYKPGETVSVKGWLRSQVQEPRGDIKLPAQRSLEYKLFDSRGNEIKKGTATLGALGGFDFRLELPKNFNLGNARVELSSNGSTHQHAFEVQEFRRPEFEVSAQAETGSSIVGGQASVSVDAKYYAGGGLKDAAVNWQVTASPTNYSPPHWEEFTFGTWTPWWDCYCWWLPPVAPANQSKSFQGVTDSKGHSQLNLEFRSVDPPRPHSVNASATVADVNRQAWNASTSLIVHPSSQYVGIKAKSTFVEPGKPLEYDLIVTDLDGKAVAGRPVQVKVYRLSWEYSDDNNTSTKKEVFAQTVTSGSAPVGVSVPTTEGGTYQVEATVQDDSNRSNQSQVTSWVSGGKQPPKRDVEMQQLTLVPNRKSYQPGDVAEILVQSPFSDAQAMVTLERHGIVERQLLELSRGSAVLRVPLEEAYLPNLHVTVDVVGQEPRLDQDGKPVAGAKPRPAQAQGSLNLEISAASRELKVEVKPRQAKSEPGAQNAIDVWLKDAQGKPVAQAEVALFVVDESVLALIGGDYADPWKLFYSLRPSEVYHSGVRQYIQLALPEELPQAQPQADMEKDALAGAPRPAPMASMAEMRQEAPMGRAMAKSRANGAASNEPAPIRVRTNFSALAYYVPAARSDAEGRLKLPFKLPDNLTRYRVVALAAAGEKQFGKGQSSLVARQPLMVRPSPPRFLNFGDRCELPVVVQNQTDQPMNVELACRATNLKVDPAKAGVSLRVPANDRVEVRFPVSAEQAGTARFQIAASSGKMADAAELDFPVWTPATTEAFATYGVVDQGAISQPVAPPGEVFKQFGGLEVSTSSTALAELTDAFLYLRAYPYECSEQISSRMLSTVALIPVLRAFDAPDMPNEKELKSSLEADIKKLQGMQNYDGGWDYWKRDKPSVPYPSLHVVHALVRLRKAGYKVPDDTYNRALQFAVDIQRHIPADYSEWARRALRGYALYVRHRAGKPDAAAARQLIQDCGGVDKTPFEILGWVLPTLSKDASSQALVTETRRHLNNRVSETASTAQFTTNYQDGEHLILASNHRDDAILLEALIQDQPQSDLLPKLVRGLLDHRVAGRWSSTQENCFVLLALEEYFQTFEKVTPDFVARLWLGQRFAGEQSFKGRSADTKELRIPMADLRGKEDLVLDKQGAGRLYYRLGMKYAPTNLKLDPMERGFSVERRYEAVDDNRDVSRQSDGSWHIKAGSKVKVTVTMVAPTMRYHVALVDPLPAGLEALNPALKGTEPTRPAPRGGARWWWNPRWYEHENLRDERVEAFSQWVWYGVHEYSYYARATTPGQFVVPPAKAEEMYHPETFGRSASDRVYVDP